MPIWQAGVMTGNEVSQYPSMHPEFLYRVLGSSCRVINSTTLTFKMRLRIITRYRFDTLLKFCTIFP